MPHCVATGLGASLIEPDSEDSERMSEMTHISHNDVYSREATYSKDSATAGIDMGGTSIKPKDFVVDLEFK